MLPNIIEKLWTPTKTGLFCLDAEIAHDLTIKSLEAYSGLPIAFSPPKWVAQKKPINLLGKGFSHPVGLAAGLDKNGQALLAWQMLGFSYVEVGTVTALPQPGNPKPRLFRLPEEKAFLNRMGFNNQGARVVAERVRRTKDTGKLTIPVGMNIGKSKVISLESAPADYLASFLEVKEVADYVVINVSSPNTPGLRELQDKESLKKILSPILAANKTSIPILLKLAPDMHDDAMLASAQLACDLGLSGMVMTNTSVDYNLLNSKEKYKSALSGGGGLSGKPIFDASTHALRVVSDNFGGKLTLVGVGGIMNRAQAREKIAAGAELLQLYSGFIYAGPGLIREINCK